MKVVPCNIGNWILAVADMALVSYFQFYMMHSPCNIEFNNFEWKTTHKLRCERKQKLNLKEKIYNVNIMGEKIIFSILQVVFPIKSELLFHYRSKEDGLPTSFL